MTTFEVKPSRSLPELRITCDYSRTDYDGTLLFVTSTEGKESVVARFRRWLYVRKVDGG